jgi:hypothetical protein
VLRARCFRRARSGFVAYCGLQHVSGAIFTLPPGESGSLARRGTPAVIETRTLAKREGQPSSPQRPPDPANRDLQPRGAVPLQHPDGSRATQAAAAGIQYPPGVEHISPGLVPNAGRTRGPACTNFAVPLQEATMKGRALAIAVVSLLVALPPSGRWADAVLYTARDRLDLPADG